MIPPILIAVLNGTDVTLPAATPTDIELPIDGARDWSFVLKNTGANPVTAGTIARSPLGVLYETPQAMPGGIPLASGADVTIVGELEPVTRVRLTLTSTLGTTVQIEGGGR